MLFSFCFRCLVNRERHGLFLDSKPRPASVSVSPHSFIDVQYTVHGYVMEQTGDEEGRKSGDGETFSNLYSQYT